MLYTITVYSFVRKMLCTVKTSSPVQIVLSASEKRQSRYHRKTGNFMSYGGDTGEHGCLLEWPYDDV